MWNCGSSLDSVAATQGRKNLHNSGTVILQCDHTIQEEEKYGMKKQKLRIDDLQMKWWRVRWCPVVTGGDLPSTHSSLVSACHHGHAQCIKSLFLWMKTIEFMNRGQHTCSAWALVRGHGIITAATMKRQWWDKLYWMPSRTCSQLLLRTKKKK